jgi:hypothetical protein
MTETQKLMANVKRICGPLFDAISQPTAPTTFPKSFVMALTANETGIYLVNNPDVPPRFEPAIYGQLLATQTTGKAFGSITQAMLMSVATDRLRQYASSWGLTQIMGYNVLPWEGWNLADIQNPETHYKATLRLLDEFARDFWLDPAKDFLEFFRCWNTGNPHGKTFDPNYADNGIARMEAYQSLEA